jgi:hypothetical protein
LSDTLTGVIAVLQTFFSAQPLKATAKTAAHKTELFKILILTPLNFCKT